jgi:hypothetical protein
MPSHTPIGAPDYRLGPDVILLPVQDGTVRLLNLGGRFYAVAAVGAQMLRATLERGTAAAVQHIAAQYGVARERVEADLTAFVADLQRQGLLVSGRARQRLGRAGAGLPYLLLAPVLGGIHRLAASVTVKAWLLLALTRLCLCLFGWTRTMAAWQKYHGARAGSRVPDDRTVTAIDEAIRQAAANHLFPVECKERALSCWALLRSAEVPAALVVGIKLYPLAGHCWCEVGSRILSDHADRCEEYTPVIRYA